MIEKVSELKEKYLHMRCVVLQLLKSLDLKYALIYVGVSRNKHKEF